MKSAVLAAIVAAALGAGVRCYADDGSSAEANSTISSIMTWFKHLKQGLAESAVESDYQNADVTAVAAVRGAKQDPADANKPAWLGGSRSKKSAELRKEKSELAKAVDLIISGKTKEGLARLDVFEKAHPKSPLLAEVKQARSKAKALGAGAKTPAGGASAKP